MAEMLDEAHDVLLNVNQAVVPELETEKPDSVFPPLVYPVPDTSSVPTLEDEGVPELGVPTFVRVES